MSRQWIRDLRLTVTAGGDAIDVSALRIRFRVRQEDSQKPNNAEILITNPSTATIQKIKKEGQTVSLEAGYEEDRGGVRGLIFKGDLIQKRSGRDNPVETYLALLAASGDRAYTYATVSKTLAAGSTFKDQVDVAAESLKKYGIELGYIADLGSQKMPRARTLFGSTRDLLRDIATATDSSWSIQNQKLQIIKNREKMPGNVHVINSRTGMVGLPEQTFDGIMCKMLLNPKIIPGSIIKIDQASVQEQAFSPNYAAEAQNAMIPSIAEDGMYRVLVAEHTGDTRGLPWYTDVVCIRADGQGPLPIGLAGRGISLDPGDDSGN
jgi:hypothetical protein